LKKPPKISFLIGISVSALLESYFGIKGNRIFFGLSVLLACKVIFILPANLPNPYAMHEEKNSKNLPDPE
jgi:hypothetical protein